MRLRLLFVPRNGFAPGLATGIGLCATGIALCAMLAGCGWSYEENNGQGHAAADADRAQPAPAAPNTAGSPAIPNDDVHQPARVTPDHEIPARADAHNGTGDGADLIQDPDGPDAQPRQPRPQPSGNDRDLLEDVIRQQRERINELKAASRVTIERSRQLVAAGEVERAQRLLVDVLDELRRWESMDPELAAAANEVQAYYSEVRGLSGEGFGARDQGAESDSMRALIEEARATARQYFENAEAFMAEGGYESALDWYDRVKEVIRWAPYGSNLNEMYASRVEARIREANDLMRKREWDDQVRHEGMIRELEILERRREEEQQRETLEALWGEALFNMNLRRFSTAEQICTQILALDPGFQDARNMLRDIEGLARQAQRDENQQRRLDQYRRLWASWYESKIPLAGQIIEYPTGDEWERIKSRASSLQIDYAESTEVQRIKAVLRNEYVDRLEYDEVELGEVVEEIRRRSNLPLVIHPSIVDDVSDVEISVAVGNLLWGNALNIICELAEVRYLIVPEGVCWIVNDDVDIEPPMIVRLHDVRDLTIRVKDFAGTRIRLRGNDTGGGGGVIFEDEDELVEPIETDTLAEIIEDAVMVDSWDLDGASIQTVAGQLLVRNMPEVHAEIQRFLQDLRDVSGIVITIETRFITIDDMFLSDFGVDWRGLGGQSPGNTVLLDDVTVGAPDFAGGTVDNGANGVPPGAAIAGLFFNDGTIGTTTDIRGRFENLFDNALGNFLRSTGGLGLQYTIFNQPDMQFNLVITALEKSRNATVLVAPRLSAFNTQRANLTVINQVSYVRDFSVQTAVSAAIADPIIDTISDGLVLDIKPTVSNDRRFVTIELRPSVAQLLRPIPTFTTTLGAAGSSPVTIQIPELSVQSAETTVMCPDGGIVVVGGLKTIRDIDRESSVPLLGDIPIIGTLFKRKGRSLENRSLIIVVKAVVTDLREQESRRP